MVMQEYFKTKDGYRLGMWVSRLRTDYKTGKLTQERMGDALAVWDYRKEGQARRRSGSGDA